jgi:hypothetical protein
MTSVGSVGTRAGGRTPTPHSLGAVLAAGGPTNGAAANLVLWAAAVLMAASALIHLRLWGAFHYRAIPTIGPLFLFQAIAGLALAAAVAAVRRVWTAAVAFGLVASTIGGFVLSVNVGLFGFEDTWSAPWAGAAFAIEVAALVLLAAGGALSYLRSLPGRRAGPPAGHLPG